MRYALLALVWALVCGEVFAAPSAPKRSSSVLGFFSWSPRVPAELRAALDDYERGRLFEAVAAADHGLRSAETEGFRDDLLLVRGLALAGLGWRKEATESFAGVLETPTPSPYYPLALAGLVECHHQEGRFDAVAESYHRYFERPWRGASRRDRMIRNFFSAYGELSTSKLRLERDEADLLMSPTVLAQKLQRRKERPSERLLYLSGLDLFRVKDYAASLQALETIGLVSFYYPYALYTGAQDLYALGRPDDSRAKIAALFRYPPITAEEQALAERAGLFLVQLLFDSGRTDDALEAARRLGGDGRYALEARLFRAEIYLATGQPSLALAFYEDLRDKKLGPRLDAERGLDLGAAYSKLGDLSSAAASLKAAADEVSRALASLERPGADPGLEELRARVEKSVAAEKRVAASDRRRIAAGVRRAFAFKGPLNFGKLVRVIFASHRDTILGEPVYDLQLLAEAARPAWLEPAGRDGLWFEYLHSPERAAIESAVSARLELDAAAGERDRALGALDALLGVLDGRLPGSGKGDSAELARLATRVGEELRGGGEGKAFSLRADPGAPLASEIAESRRLIIETVAAEPSTGEIDPALLEEAHAAAVRRLDEAVSFGLRQVAKAEAEELRRLEFHLQAELSQTLAKQSGIAHSSAEP